MKGLWIPEWMNELNLKGSAKELYALIVSLHTQGNGCFASNKFLADSLGLKPDTISRLISKLKKQGLVSQASFDGRKRFLVPLRFGKESNADLESNPIQDRREFRGRVGQPSNSDSAKSPVPCTKIKVQKIKDINIGRNSEKSWQEFLLFSEKLSRATASRIQNYQEPDKLPPDLRIYYDRFRFAA